MLGWLSSLWYDFGYVVCLPSFTFAWSMRFQGSHHLPARGPALLVANHQSFLDPVLIGVRLESPLELFARQDIVQTRFFRKPYP